MSHLLQMRGLKRTIQRRGNPRGWSHLLQMRGLKQKQYQMQQAMYGSHLLQMRGLKPVQGFPKEQRNVASFTDAWIETSEVTKEVTGGQSRIFYRCVD